MHSSFWKIHKGLSILWVLTFIFHERKTPTHFSDRVVLLSYMHSIITYSEIIYARKAHTHCSDGIYSFLFCPDFRLTCPLCSGSQCWMLCTKASSVSSFRIWWVPPLSILTTPFIMTPSLYSHNPFIYCYSNSVMKAATARIEQKGWLLEAWCVCVRVQDFVSTNYFAPIS